MDVRNVLVGGLLLISASQAVGGESSRKTPLPTPVVIAYDSTGKAALIVNGQPVGFADKFAIDPKYVPDPMPKPRDPKDPKDFPKPTPTPKPHCTKPCIEFTEADGDITKFGPEGRDLTTIRVRDGAIEKMHSDSANLDR